MFGISMVYIWLGLTVLFAVIEVLTTDIATIWFAIGSLGATITAWIAPQAVMVQAVVFIVVTVITMYFTKPLLNKYITKKTPTNMDMYIGKEAEVISPVSPQTTGRAKVGGLTWQIKSADEINAGEMCTIVKIEGASLVVEKLTVKQ